MKVSDQLMDLMNKKEGMVFKYFIDSASEQGILICKETYSSLDGIKKIAQKATENIPQVCRIHVFDVYTREIKASYIGKQEGGVFTPDENTDTTRH